MAFKATPEAFDAFDQLDQDSKAGVLKSMSSADQTAFITAYEKARAQPAQPEEPSMMDRLTSAMAAGSIGTYKRLVGIEPTQLEQSALETGGGGIAGLAANLLPKGPNAARLVAGDFLQALDPVLAYVGSQEGGEQRLGIADAKGTIVPEVAKAANQLSENNTAAAVVRFVPQAAANLVGDTGIAAVVGAKALGLLGREAGPLARGAAAVAGSVSENLGQEALGSFIGGEEGAVSRRLKDVITDPFSVALMAMPGLLAMRRVKPGIAVETPDLRDPKLIMKEGGDVHRSIASPEELEATVRYKGEPLTDLNPVKTELGKRKLGERPPTQDSEFDKRVNQVMSLAEAREGKLRTQISEIPGPITEAAEAAARAEYIRVAADDSQPIVAAVAAADRARERVMREWLGVPPLKPTDADVAGLNWDAFGDSPRDGQKTVNMRAPGAQQDTIPGRNGRPYLGEAPTPGRGMHDAPTQVNVLAKRALEGEALRDPVTDPRIDPTFVGKVVEGEIAKPRKLLGAGEVIEPTVKRKLGENPDPVMKTPAVREQMSRAEVKRLLTAETVVGPDWQGRPDAIPSARAAKDRQARAAKLHAVDPLTGRPFEARTPSLPDGERTRAGGPPFKSIVLPEGKALRNAQRGTLFYLDERGKVHEAPLWESANEGAAVNVKSPALERYLELNSKGSGPGGPGGPPIDSLTRPPEFGPGHRGLDAASSLKARVERDSVGLQAFFRDLQAQVSIPPNYAARDVAPYLHEAKAAGAMHKAAFEKNALKLNEAWKALTPAQRNAWESVIKRIQNNKPVSWTEVPEPVRALTKHYVEGMHKQVHMLSAAGYFTPEQSRLFAQRAAEGHVPLARDYEIFFKGKKFRADVSAYSQALEYLMGKGKSGGEADAAIRQVMDAYYNRRRQGSAEAKIGSADVVKSRSDLEAAIAKVMGEKAIPPQMRALFGEITDPRFVVAMNAAELERVTRQYAWTKAFTEELPEGSAWVSAAKYDKMPLMQKAKFHPQMVGLEGASPTANKQLFGELAGKYVTRDVWEALNGSTATKLNNVVFDTLGKFQSWFRAAKTLFSPLSFVRNFLSNTASSAVSGLPVWDPRFYKHQLQSLRAHLDYRKSLSLNDARGFGEAKWIVKAMEDNAIPPGRGQDIIDGDAVKVLEDIIQRDSKAGFLGLADRLFKAASTGKMKLANIYELMDSIPRLAVYRFQVERGMSNGLSERVARQRASSIVNRYFASSANLGPALQQISKLPFFGPFMGWAADNVRVHKNIMVDTARALTGQGNQTLNPASGEGFGPMVNTLLHKTLFLGALGAGARALFGVSDQELNDAREALSPSWKSDHPFYDVITVPGADGQLYAISLDTFDPMATFMRGTDHPVTRVMGNILKTFSDGGLMEGPVDALVPFGARPQQRRETMPGEELDSVAQRAWDYLAPGVLTQWQSAMRKLETPALNVRPGEPWMTREPLRQGEEPLTLTEAFNRYINPATAPFLFEKIGGRNATSTRKRESSEVRSTQNLPKKIGQNPNLSPLQKEKYKLGARQKVNELKSK